MSLLKPSTWCITLFGYALVANYKKLPDLIDITNSKGVVAQYKRVTGPLYKKV